MQSNRAIDRNAGGNCDPSQFGTTRGMRLMLNRRIGKWLVVALLLAAPALSQAQSNSTPWELSGNNYPTIPAPIGPWQQDGSGFWTAIEFMYMNQQRAIGDQVIAQRGFIDSAGLVTGDPGAFRGTGETALDTASWGRTTWQPGVRLSFGYRFESGVAISLSWLHLYDAKYSGGAGAQGPFFQNPGRFLENTLLFSPVYNFSPFFNGPSQRVTDAQGNPLPGALNGIWNGASEMTILYTQRFDNFDLTGRFPVYESENARTYALAGARKSWIWERFQWRTVAYGFQPDGNGGTIAVAGGADAARYVNTLSQNMYGGFVGAGHEVYLGNGFGVGLESTGALLLNYAKERAKYIREDERTQTKRSWSNFSLVPNINLSLNLSWQPVDGLKLQFGWNAMTFFNTYYMDKPVGFNMGAIDPAYETKVFRYLQGLNFGVGYTW